MRNEQFTMQTFKLHYNHQFSSPLASKLQHINCVSYLLLHLPCEGILHIPTSSHHCESANDHRIGWPVETWSHTGHTCNSPPHPPWQNLISSYEAAPVRELALHPAPPAFLLYVAHCQSPAHMFLIFNECLHICYRINDWKLHCNSFIFSRCQVQITARTSVILTEVSWCPSVPTGTSCDSAIK